MVKYTVDREKWGILMKIYGLKACDTCRKAVKATGAELVDVRENPLTRKELERFHTEFGAALVNQRSTTWRGLTETERAGEAVELLMTYPALMKRPVIEKGGALWLGWSKDVQAALLN